MRRWIVLKTPPNPRPSHAEPEGLIKPTRSQKARTRERTGSHPTTKTPEPLNCRALPDNES
ncbi:MAG: hypothetical protein RIT19_1288, partial [Verrucomicrobiota bacterium]